LVQKTHIYINYVDLTRQDLDAIEYDIIFVAYLYNVYFLIINNTKLNP